MRKTIGIITSLCISSFVHAQGTVEMDAVAFARDSGKTQVEIYYSILQGSLRSEEKNGEWIIPINARVDVWQDGKVLARQDIHKEKSFKGTKAGFDSSNRSLILDGAAMSVSMKTLGEAVLILFTKNAQGAEIADTIHRNFVVPSIIPGHFILGGIELASSVSQTGDRSNPFEKFGYLIMPNPSRSEE